MKNETKFDKYVIESGGEQIVLFTYGGDTIDPPNWCPDWEDAKNTMKENKSPNPQEAMQTFMACDKIIVVRDPILACGVVKLPKNLVATQGFMTPDGACFGNSLWGWNPFMTGYFLEAFKTQITLMFHAWLCEGYVDNWGPPNSKDWTLQARVRYVAANNLLDKINVTKFGNSASFVPAAYLWGEEGPSNDFKDGDNMLSVAQASCKYKFSMNENCKSEKQKDTEKKRVENNAKRLLEKEQKAAAKVGKSKKRSPGSRNTPSSRAAKKAKAVADASPVAGDVETPKSFRSGKQLLSSVIDTVTSRTMKDNFKRCKVIQPVEDSDDDETDTALLRNMAKFASTKANMIEIEQKIEGVKGELQRVDTRIKAKTTDIEKIEERIELINDTDKVQEKIDFYTNLRDNKEVALQEAKKELQKAEERKTSLEENKNEFDTQLSAEEAKFNAAAVECWDAWDEIPDGYKFVRKAKEAKEGE